MFITKVLIIKKLLSHNVSCDVATADLRSMQESLAIAAIAAAPVPTYPVPPLPSNPKVRLSTCSHSARAVKRGRHQLIERHGSPGTPRP